MSPSKVTTEILRDLSPTLQHLNHHNAYDPIPIDLLVSCTSLISLRAYQRFSSEHLCRIARSLPLTSLHILGNTVTDEVIPLFGKLESLYLTGSMLLTGESLRFLPSLTSLTLVGPSAITRDNLSVLTNLLSLHIGNNEWLTNDTLSNFSLLTSLVANFCSVTEEIRTLLPNLVKLSVVTLGTLI